MRIVAYFTALHAHNEHTTNHTTSVTQLTTYYPLVPSPHRHRLRRVREDRSEGHHRSEINFIFKFWYTFFRQRTADRQIGFTGINNKTDIINKPWTSWQPVDQFCPSLLARLNELFIRLHFIKFTIHKPRFQLILNIVSKCTIFSVNNFYVLIISN